MEQDKQKILDILLRNDSPPAGAPECPVPLPGPAIVADDDIYIIADIIRAKNPDADCIVLQCCKCQADISFRRDFLKKNQTQVFDCPGNFYQKCETKYSAVTILNSLEDQ